MRGFGPDAVRADPSAVGFHDALSAGPDALQEFVRASPLWWKPVARGPFDPAWRALFEASPVFRSWVERHGDGEP